MPDKPTDTATSNDPKQQERDDLRHSPGAGCFIFSMIFAVFGGIIVFAIYNGVRQDRDIVKFTDEDPTELPHEAGTPGQVTAIREKFTTFTETIRESKQATLELSASELNILLHNETALIDSRELFYFENITPEAITGKLSWPIKRLNPWKPRRYLNGKAVFVLEASPGRIFLRLKSIDSPGNEISEGFMGLISQNDLLKPYKTDDTEDIFDAIQSAEMRDGSVIVTAGPPSLPITK